MPYAPTILNLGRYPGLEPGSSVTRIFCAVWSRSYRDINHKAVVLAGGLR
jgi:hypothetical protein